MSENDGYGDQRRDEPREGCSGLNGIMQARVAQGLCAAVVRIVSLERGAERSSSEL